MKTSLMGSLVLGLLSVSSLAMEKTSVRIHTVTDPSDFPGYETECQRLVEEFAERFANTLFRDVDIEAFSFREKVFTECPTEELGCDKKQVCEAEVLGPVHQVRFWESLGLIRKGGGSSAECQADADQFSAQKGNVFVSIRKWTSFFRARCQTRAIFVRPTGF